MALKQFKTESKRILDLMIHSIYTHKEIFLRELISNSSDAIDKLYYMSLTSDKVGLNRGDFYIRIDIDKKNRTLTVSDNGIGMSKEELETNLGTIANSGSLNFKKDNELKKDIEIIGQFGVGFYSSFMVSDCVTVISRLFGEDKAYKWESKGIDGYTVTECEKEGFGTDIILKIKENSDEEKFDEYLEQYRIKDIVKKYSDYIRYPIKMQIEKSRPKEDNKDEYETYLEDETINCMIPIWRKNKKELKEEDYNNFYKEKHFDYENPLKTIHMHNEGTSEFNALLYIPAKAPYNFYTREYEKGLELYSSGVLIMEKCADLLPDFFGFVKGLVDSEDLSLNISREMLQHDRQLKAIAAILQKKIKSELLSMLKKEREKYDIFYKNFGIQLKYGIYSGFGANKDILKDLIMFYSSKEKKQVTLGEYISRMDKEQKYIYYASGESLQKIENLPQTEMVADKGYEILYFTDDIDEFAVRILNEYEGKEFRSVSSGDLGLEKEEEKETKGEKESNKEMLEFMKEALGDKIKDVRISKRLKSHPVCLSTDGEVSLEMEKILNSMPGVENNKVKADRILEINENHKVFKTLNTLFNDNKDKLKNYTDILYNQALLIEGISIEDPVSFSNAVCELMAE